MASAQTWSPAPTSATRSVRRASTSGQGSPPWHRTAGCVARRWCAGRRLPPSVRSQRRPFETSRSSAVALPTVPLMSSPKLRCPGTARRPRGGPADRGRRCRPGAGPGRRCSSSATGRSSNPRGVRLASQPAGTSISNPWRGAATVSGRAATGPPFSGRGQVPLASSSQGRSGTTTTRASTTARPSAVAAANRRARRARRWRTGRRRRPRPGAAAATSPRACLRRSSMIMAASPCSPRSPTSRARPGAGPARGGPAT